MVESLETQIELNSYTMTKVRIETEDLAMFGMLRAAVIEVNERWIKGEREWEEDKPLDLVKAVWAILDEPGLSEAWVNDTVRGAIKGWKTAHAGK